MENIIIFCLWKLILNLNGISAGECHKYVYVYMQVLFLSTQKHYIILHQVRVNNSHVCSNNWLLYANFCKMNL